MDESDSDRSQKLFRKVALARLSSPDRLDILLGISRPQTILAWIGAAILLGAFLFWGFTWPVEQKVVGRCILTSPSGIAEVTASAAGVVGGLSVKLGDRVAANQVIGRIVRSELDDQIRHARDRLAELERRREDLADEVDLTGELRRRRRAVGLVLGECLGAERGARYVECHSNVRGPFVAQHIDEHRREPEHRVGRLARGGGEVLHREGIERAIGKGMAVEQELSLIHISAPTRPY